MYVCVYVEICTYAHMPLELRSGAEVWVASCKSPIHAAVSPAFLGNLKDLSFMCIYGHVACHSTGRGQRVTL